MSWLEDKMIEFSKLKEHGDPHCSYCAAEFYAQGARGLADELIQWAKQDEAVDGTIFVEDIIPKIKELLGK
jgi:hypothetical protein